jgi:hypothetical protein
MTILPTDIQILFTNYDIIAYFKHIDELSKARRPGFLPTIIDLIPQSTRLYNSDIMCLGISITNTLLENKM